jgi:hypothetical protein
VTAIRRDGDAIVLSFEPRERTVLGDAARDLAELLAGAETARDADPALQRLLPDGYRDDPDSAAEFATWTRTDLAAGKIEIARSLAAALDQAGDGSDGGSGEVVLDRAGVTRWLRGLTDLRVALAERLGIRTDDDPTPETPGGAVYWWLGETQEMLVATVDRWDAEGGA